MKKVILVFALVSLCLSFVDCKKNGKSNAITPTVYCMYTKNDPAAKVYRGCATSKEEMQNKAIEFRDAGYFQFTTVEKSTCQECQ